jgi:outer membrane protein TolC
MNLNPKQIPAGLPSTVLENRPDIVMAEYQLELANANIGLARSEFFPSIDLTSFVGGASLALNNLFTVGTGLWTAQAALNIPVLNMSTFAESDKAQAQYEAAYHNYIDTVKSAFSQVDDSLNYYGYMNISLEAQNQVLKLSNKQFHASERKLELGSISKTQKLLQKIQLDHARLGQLEVKSAQLIGLAMAYQALAAGYNTKNTDPQKTTIQSSENKSGTSCPAKLNIIEQGDNHQQIINKMMSL